MPNYCTSCVPGYTKRGWKCRNNVYVSFTFVISVTLTIAVGDIDSIVVAIYLIIFPQMSNFSSSTYDTSFIDLEGLASGSTVVTGAAAPSGSDPSAVSAALSVGLSNGLPGTNYTVTSSQVSVQGVAAE